MLPTPTINATHYYHYHDNPPLSESGATEHGSTAGFAPAALPSVFLRLWRFLKVHRRDSSVVSQFLGDALPFVEPIYSVSAG